MAADLHRALEALAPVHWTDVPLDALPRYLTDTFTAGELLCNSVPPPANGEPFHAAKPHHPRPNLARSANDMHASLARAFPPHKHHEELQRHWGKPYKFKAEQNPHAVALYKMAGHDRHGAWFARRSVHEGLGFAQFQKAMRREFPHSLTVPGGPGAGAVRGLAGTLPCVCDIMLFQLTACRRPEAGAHRGRRCRHAGGLPAQRAVPRSRDAARLHDHAPDHGRCAGREERGGGGRRAEARASPLHDRVEAGRAPGCPGALGLREGQVRVGGADPGDSAAPGAREGVTGG